MKYHASDGHGIAMSFGGPLIDWLVHWLIKYGVMRLDLDYMIYKELTKSQCVLGLFSADTMAVFFAAYLLWHWNPVGSLLFMRIPLSEKEFLKIYSIPAKLVSVYFPFVSTTGLTIYWKCQVSMSNISR